MAAIRFEGDVNTNVGGNVVAFDSACVTTIPSANQREIIGTFASNMDLAKMRINLFRSLKLK